MTSSGSRPSGARSHSGQATRWGAAALVKRRRQDGQQDWVMRDPFRWVPWPPSLRPLPKRTPERSFGPPLAVRQAQAQLDLDGERRELADDRTGPAVDLHPHVDRAGGVEAVRELLVGAA